MQTAGLCLALLECVLELSGVDGHRGGAQRVPERHVNRKHVFDDAPLALFFGNIKQLHHPQNDVGTGTTETRILRIGVATVTFATSDTWTIHNTRWELVL